MINSQYRKIVLSLETDMCYSPFQLFQAKSRGEEALLGWGVKN